MTWDLCNGELGCRKSEFPQQCLSTQSCSKGWKSWDSCYLGWFALDLWTFSVFKGSNGKLQDQNAHRSGEVLQLHRKTLAFAELRVHCRRWTMFCYLRFQRGLTTLRTFHLNQGFCCVALRQVFALPDPIPFRLFLSRYSRFLAWKLACEWALVHRLKLLPTDLLMLVVHCEPIFIWKMVFLVSSPYWGTPKQFPAPSHFEWWRKLASRWIKSSS